MQFVDFELSGAGAVSLAGGRSNVRRSTVKGRLVLTETDITVEVGNERRRVAAVKGGILVIGDVDKPAEPKLPVIEADAPDVGGEG